MSELQNIIRGLLDSLSKRKISHEIYGLKSSSVEEKKVQIWPKSKRNIYPATYTAAWVAFHIKPAAGGQKSHQGKVN
jgi:hypothetical protein